VGVAATVGVVAITAAVAWFAWFPHWRPDLRGGERFDLDVGR
jgi:hypothetical protein